MTHLSNEQLKSKLETLEERVSELEKENEILSRYLSHLSKELNQFHEPEDKDLPF